MLSLLGEKIIMTPNDYLIKVLASYFSELLGCTVLNERGMSEHSHNISIIETHYTDVLLLMKLNTPAKINSMYTVGQLMSKYPTV